MKKGNYVSISEYATSIGANPETIHNRKYTDRNFPRASVVVSPSRRLYSKKKLDSYFSRYPINSCGLHKQKDLLGSVPSVELAKADDAAWQIEARFARLEEKVDRLLTLCEAH